MRRSAFRFYAKNLVILLETCHSLIKGESVWDLIGTAALLAFKVRVMHKSVVPLEVPEGPVRNLFSPRVFKYAASLKRIHRVSKPLCAIHFKARITTVCRRAFLASFELPALRNTTRTAGHCVSNRSRPPKHSTGKYGFIGNKMWLDMVQ